MPAWRFDLPRRRPGSLGAKLLLILTGVGLLGSVAITLLLAAVITPSFNQLEAASVDAHVARTRAALNENIAKVETAVRDYGDWNSSYDYMGHPTAAFEKESFSTLAMANLDVSGMAYIGNDGRVVIARWLDLARGADYPAMRRQLIERIRRIDFRRAVGNSNSSAFYARVGRVVAAVGVAQVRRSDGSGEPRGYVLMVRQITSQQLSKLLQIGARLDPAQADRPVVTPSRSKMTIGVPILGADGHAVASVSFTVPREVSTLGTRMLMLAIVGSTVLLMVLLAVLSRAIARLVLAPLNRVERHMHVVTASGSLSLLEGEEDRRDEIGSLGRSFNKMLRQLKDLREQLEVQSFALGKTESAVAVMHNVRNALNPISTILSRGLADAPPADKTMIDRALGELARDDIPAARRQKLAAFVAAAIAGEEAARSDRARQLKTGREAMQHVLEIIGTQQAQAHERPPLDTCDVTDLIAQNATIARYSDETSIAFEFPAKPWLVLANRIILSQVIGNLFGNAAEAIAAKGTGSGSIRVAVSEQDSVVTIVIRDDGEGFSPEVGATLFQRGYSTRQHKSGGLGLHWCANSMNAMEGSLRLDSEGKGLGATATLTLKAAPVTAARAAA